MCKLTFEDHVRGIVSRFSQRIGVLRLMKRIFVDTFVLFRCYFAFVLPILEYCSPVWGSAAKCHLQLLERQVYLVARLSIRVSCRCVIDVALLGLLYCTRLIRTLITVCLASFHLLLLEFGITELPPQLIHWNLKYQGVERPNLLEVFSPSQGSNVAFKQLLCTVFDTGTLDGSKGESAVGCFPESCFLLFSVAQVLVGLRKQFINNFVFPTWACAACFNNNNNNNNEVFILRMQKRELNCTQTPTTTKNTSKLRALLYYAIYVKNKQLIQQYILIYTPI